MTSQNNQYRDNLCYKLLCNNQLKNSYLELDKTGFRGNEENKEIA